LVRPLMFAIIISYNGVFFLQSRLKKRGGICLIRELYSLMRNFSGKMSLFGM
jgi:hypothetical protein